MGYLAAALFGAALFALRLIPAGQERFAFDEAHHAGWARLIANGDPFMHQIAADKPPQLYYLVALAFKLFGENETAARLPNALLGTLIILPLWGLTRRLYPTQPLLGPVVVGLFALSPLAQVYAPTVFTDPVMAFWLVMSVWLLSRENWGLGGLAFGMALCGKQQALFFLPYPVFIGLISYLTSAKRPSNLNWRSFIPLLKAAIGVAIPVLLLIGFDKWRGQTSSLTYGAALNGEKLTLASPTQWPGRVAEWWNRVLQYFFVPNPFGWLLLLGLTGFLVWTLKQLWDMWRKRRNEEQSLSDPAYSKTILTDAALFAATGIVLVWHTALTFPVWDRYLLPLVPFAALLVARLLAWGAYDLPPKGARPRFTIGKSRDSKKSYSPTQNSKLKTQNYSLALLTLVTLGLMVQPVAMAATYQLPLGGDYLAFGGSGPGQHYAYDGIDELATFFRNNTRPGAAVFQEEMDWHFSYYLFGIPLEIPSNKSQLLDPAQIAARAAKGESYVVFADWQSSSYKRLRQGLAPYGLQLEEALEVYPFSDEERRAWVVYRVARV